MSGKTIEEIHFMKLVDDMAKVFSEIEVSATKVKQEFYDDDEKCMLLLENIRLTAYTNWKELVDKYGATTEP